MKLKDKCLKCGYCCHCNYYEGDNTYHTDIKCNLLNEDNTCSIYKTRDKAKPEYCMTIDELIDKDLFKYLPITCGYKRG